MRLPRSPGKSIAIAFQSSQNSGPMKHRLKLETKRLEKSWMQYDAAMLQDYLIEEVEDPRINIQSILSRHFLIEGLFGNRFAALQKEELRFAAVMNWLLRLKTVAAEDAQDLLH